MILAIVYIAAALFVSIIWQTAALLQWTQALNLDNLLFILWWVLFTLPVAYLAFRRWFHKDIPGFWYPLLSWLVWSIFLLGTAASLRSGLRITGWPIISQYADIFVAFNVVAMLCLWLIVGYHTALRTRSSKQWVFAGIPLYLIYTVWYTYAPAIGLLVGIWLTSILYFIPPLLFVWFTWATVKKPKIDVLDN